MNLPLTLIILNVIDDGAFFFLPVMVAAAAAIKFKTNLSLAIAIAGVLVHPSFIDLMAKAAQGQPVEFLGFSVTALKYTYTVIPALCMTWLLSYIERWVDRITPAVTKSFLKPMLIVLISAPIAIMFIGPLGIWIGSGINPELRQTALAAAASAVVAGISEPALYGVALRLKRPLIASLISGFVVRLPESVGWQAIRWHLLDYLPVASSSTRPIQ